MHWRRTRLRIALTALIAVAVVACDDGPAEPTYVPGAPLTVADVEGTWSVDVPRTVACVPSRDPFVIHFELDHSHLADYLGTGGEEYFVGPWWVDPEAEPFFLQGWVDMKQQTFRFLLWQGTHVKGTVLRGRFVPGGHMRASLEEPIPPGSGWAADPIPGYPGGFSIGSCQWSVEGRRAES